MGSFDLLISFTIATALFAYVPGPAILYAMAQTVALGRRGGLMAALGMHLGGYAHVFFAAFGLSALLQYIPVVFSAVKIGGALYLIWLGVDMIRNRQIDIADRVTHDSQRQAMVRSITVEILYPKTALFYLAFVPQFVDPSAHYPVWVQIVILGIIVNLAFSSADLVVIYFTSVITQRLKRRGGLTRALRMFGGSILVGLGVRLGFEQI